MLKLLFMGTPAFAVPCLQTLLNHPDEVQVVGVITQPDRPSGRGKKLTPSPVKVLAEAHSLPVLQPERLRKDEDMMAWIEAQQADALITIAFGQILPLRVLQASRLGTINVHASLLPAYRGANPIQWSILNGDTTTGLTTMFSDEGVDTGAMLLTSTTDIYPNDTTGSLAERLSHQAGDLLMETLRQLVAGTLEPQPQPNEGITLAPKLKKEQAVLDFSHPAHVVERTLRALLPAPGAVAILSLNDDATDATQHLRLKLHQASVADVAGSPFATSAAQVGQVLALTKQGLWVQCGHGTVLQLEKLQPPSKNSVAAADWARSALPNPSNARFIPLDALPLES